MRKNTANWKSLLREGKYWNIQYRSKIEGFFKYQYLKDLRVNRDLRATPFKHTEVFVLINML